MPVNIDVTLRDGGYRNAFAFTLDYVLAHSRLSIDAGFEWVEIAYRNGSFRPMQLGLTGRGDDDLISSVAREIGAGRVGLILHPKNITEADLPAMYRAGARLGRICIAAAEPLEAFDAIVQAKECGFTVCANLTRVSQLTVRQLLNWSAGRPTRVLMPSTLLTPTAAWCRTRWLA